MTIGALDYRDAPVVRYLCPKQVARKLRVSDNTVRRWARELPGFPTRHDRGFSEHEVDQWIARSKIQPTGPVLAPWWNS